MATPLSNIFIRAAPHYAPKGALPALLGPPLLFQLGFPGTQLFALLGGIAGPHVRGDFAQRVLEALARSSVPDLVVVARAALTNWRGARRGGLRRLADGRRIVRTDPTCVGLVRNSVGRTRPVGVSGDAASRTTVDEHQGQGAARSHMHLPSLRGPKRSAA